MKDPFDENSDIDSTESKVMISNSKTIGSSFRRKSEADDSHQDYDPSEFVPKENHVKSIQNHLRFIKLLGNGATCHVVLATCNMDIKERTASPPPTSQVRLEADSAAATSNHDDGDHAGDTNVPMTWDFDTTCHDQPGKTTNSTNINTKSITVARTMVCMMMIMIIVSKQQIIRIK